MGFVSLYNSCGLWLGAEIGDGHTQFNGAYTDILQEYLE